MAYKFPIPAAYLRRMAPSLFKEATVGTDNQFDVDKCVGEDERQCEVAVGQAAGAEPAWVRAWYVGPNGTGWYVARPSSKHPCRSVLTEFPPHHIRNIRPKPRTVKLQLWMSDNGTLMVCRIGADARMATSLPAADAPSITIDLDKCREVEAEVMTPDELWGQGLIFIGLSPVKGWIIKSGNAATWDGERWSLDEAKQYPTFAVAQIEATRIVREKLHER